MGIPSAPLSNSFFEDDFDGNETLNNVVGSHRGIPATVQPSFPRSSFIMAEDRFGNVEFSDEEHARKLEQDMIDEERRRKQRKQHLQQQRDSYRATSSMNRGSNNVNTVSGCDHVPSASTGTNIFGNDQSKQYREPRHLLSSNSPNP
jgi:hypothetical protein